MSHYLWLFIFSITCCFLSSKETNTDISLNAKTEEEALFVRRIIEFYQEEENELFLNQINEFFRKHPKSALRDDLFALLGDYYMENKSYEKAGRFFAKIKNETIKKKVIINYLQALYNTHAYSKSIEVATPFLEGFASIDIDKHNSIHFFYAEALYRSSLSTELDKETSSTMAAKAIQEFEGLIQTKLSIQSMRPLAHLYYLFEKFPLSANIYIKLSEKDIENKEYYLFQAAVIEAKFDKEKSIKTFAQICNLRSSYAPDAAYNRMVLLFETGHYPELILAKDQLSKLLVKEKKPLLHFFVGRAHLKREDYKRAESSLKKFIKFEGFSCERKVALLSLGEIAQKNGNSELFEKIVKNYESSYDDKENYLTLLLASANTFKKKKDYVKAQEQYEKIVKLEVAEGLKLDAKFEYGHMLFLNKKWALCRENFAKFIRENTSHENTLAALNFLLRASNELAKDPNVSFSKLELCSELELILKQKYLEKTLDEQKYRFFLAKNYFELNKFEKAINTLKPLLANCNSLPVFTEALILNGYCLKNLSRPTKEYIQFFKKAIEVNPEMEDKGKIHLTLYNAYIKLNEENKNDDNLVKASNHLYEAYLLNEPILRDNLLWASSYFLQKDKDYKKSIELLASAINLKSFSISAVELEEEIIKLSRLYKEQNCFDKQTEILDKLEKEYLKNPNIKWKYVNNVRYELAKNYEEKQQYDKAIIYYDDVFHSGPSLRGFIQAKSCLQSSRLRLALLNKKAYEMNNPEIIKVLNQLKNLTIQKSLDNEPIHLEAGIEYVELLCKIEKLPTFSQKKLSLLKKIKETFTSTDTVIDREYHDRRASNEIKNQIFEHYMKFLENEIMLCEDKNFDKSKISTTLKTLGNQNISEFLKIRINQTIKKFQTSNTENVNLEND